MLSSKATEFRFAVENKNTFFDHCDGGDPGTPKSPSIWLFGLEPGWSKTDAKAEQLTTDCKEDLDYSVETQLGWPFNRNAFKLLAALDGMPSEPSWGLDEDAARGVEVLSAVPIIFGVVSIVHKQHGQWMAVTGIILGTFCSLVALVSA